MAIRDLATHQAQYVTIAELAEYWAVSRQQIYKRIESGGLEAIRLVRVLTAFVRARHSITSAAPLSALRRSKSSTGRATLWDA